MSWVTRHQCPALLSSLTWYTADISDTFYQTPGPGVLCTWYTVHWSQSGLDSPPSLISTDNDHCETVTDVWVETPVSDDTNDARDIKQCILMIHNQRPQINEWMIISRKQENSVLVQSLGGVSSVSKIDHECREHLQLSLWWCFAGTQRYYYSSLIVLVTCCVIDLFSCIDEDWTMVINTLDISNMLVMVEASLVVWEYFNRQSRKNCQSE